MSERDAYTKDFDVIEEDFMDPHSSHTAREWWAYDEIRYLRDKVEAMRRDRDDAWYKFTELRRAYAEYRYPSLQERVKAMSMQTAVGYIMDYSATTAAVWRQKERVETPAVSPAKPLAEGDDKPTEPQRFFAQLNGGELP